MQLHKGTGDTQGTPRDSERPGQHRGFPQAGAGILGIKGWAWTASEEPSWGKAHLSVCCALPGFFPLVLRHPCSPSQMWNIFLRRTGRVLL